MCAFGDPAFTDRRRYRGRLPTDMKAIAQELREIIDRATPLLSRIPDDRAAIPREPGKWSPREVLGHLIDSASNNHQRFVRLQHSANLALPSYEQASWVASQAYQSRRWADLLELWSAYNRHLAHVLTHVPENTAGNRISVGGTDSVTFLWLAEDYVRHLRHHLQQILGREAA